MDPITLAGLGCILPVAAGAYFLLKNAKTRKAAELVAIAKQRADERVKERQFADTQPFYDPYRSAIDFNKSLHVTEVDDKYDGRGSLTPDQEQTIALIFEGYSPDPIQKSPYRITPSPQRRAGVPWSQSIFGDSKMGDYV